jgi:hypothetical protein
MVNLKNMLKSKKPIVIPGVYDAIGEQRLSITQEEFAGQFQYQ